MSAPDPDDRGMLWFNLIGLGVIGTLIILFIIFYGKGLVDLLLWLTGNDPQKGAWAP